jgi:uncharacterized membrane protein
LRAGDFRFTIRAMLSGDVVRSVSFPEDRPFVTRLLPPLIFASAVCGVLLLARWGWAGRPRFVGLFGNLLLAWIPLGLAFAIQWLRSLPVPRTRWLWFCAVCWFLFFPNASYIVTDMVHLDKHHLKDVVPKWFDLMIIMAHACTGLFLGCTALAAIESMVRERLGRRWAATLAIAMLGLASFGIYLGRFLRLNSWDVLTRPGRLVEKVVALTEPVKAFEVVAFSLTFFLFSVAVYWFFASAVRIAPEPALVRVENS